MIILRIVFSAFGWVFFAVSSAAFFPFAAILWLATFWWDKRLLAQHMLTCTWASMYILPVPGWRTRIVNRTRLPWRGAALIVANHQSLVDALVVFATFRPFKAVSRKDVEWIPFIGWNMMFNRYIRLERGQRKSIAQFAEMARFWLRRGVPIMLYPEGTRSPDGEVKEFKNGAFLLAVEEDVPVYPVVIDGTTEALPRKSLLLRISARIEARVLEPVVAKDLPGAAELAPRRLSTLLRDTVRNRMIEELAEMRAARD